LGRCHFDRREKSLDGSRNYCRRNNSRLIKNVAPLKVFKYSAFAVSAGSPWRA
jgi:hypothetical protein